MAQTLRPKDGENVPLMGVRTVYPNTTHILSVSLVFTLTHLLFVLPRL